MKLKAISLFLKKSMYFSLNLCSSIFHLSLTFFKKKQREKIDEQIRILSYFDKFLKKP